MISGLRLKERWVFSGRRWDGRCSRYSRKRLDRDTVRTWVLSRGEFVVCGFFFYRFGERFEIFGRGLIVVFEGGIW